MKFDSIKSRLVLMTLICVIGMGMLVVSQHYFTQRLIGLHQQRDVLLRLGQDLLQMRRHEKDFLLRNDTAYYEKFLGQTQTFTTRLNTLIPLFSYYQLPISEVEGLSQAVDDYRRIFHQVVSVQNRIGLSAQSGLRARINELEANLLSPSASLSQPAKELVHVLQLETRNFQIHPESKYARNIDALSTLLLDTTRSNETVGGVIVNYRDTLLELIAAYTEFGITHNDGLRGIFRQSAHSVEAQLKSVDIALKPIIEQQEAQVRVYSLSIAALTSVVLILVLIKSFATFHRAFANFVMFFYRCKRQYQKIDTKQLGFSEFKSLAELANEMVETRKAMEDRLASVEAELAKNKVT